PEIEGEDLLQVDPELDGDRLGQADPCVEFGATLRVGLLAKHCSARIAWDDADQDEHDDHDAQQHRDAGDEPPDDELDHRADLTSAEKAKGAGRWPAPFRVSLRWLTDVSWAPGWLEAVG